jgi:hypothetical protein
MHQKFLINENMIRNPPLVTDKCTWMSQARCGGRHCCGRGTHAWTLPVGCPFPPPPPLSSSKTWLSTTTSSQTWPPPLRLGLPRGQQPANLIQQYVHLLSCINNHEINSSPRRKRDNRKGLVRGQMVFISDQLQRLDTP